MVRPRQYHRIYSPMVYFSAAYFTDFQDRNLTHLDARLMLVFTACDKVTRCVQVYAKWYSCCNSHFLAVERREAPLTYIINSEPQHLTLPTSPTISFGRVHAMQLPPHAEYKLSDNSDEVCLNNFRWTENILLFIVKRWFHGGLGYGATNSGTADPSLPLLHRPEGVHDPPILSFAQSPNYMNVQSCGSDSNSVSLGIERGV